MAIRYTRREELWNSWSHAGGIVMGVVFGVVFLWMAFRGDNPWSRLGVCLYLFGMLGSYVASTLYHALPRRSVWKERLRRWDHAAIYWHIAGSYTCRAASIQLSIILHQLSVVSWLELVFVCLAVCHCRNHCQFCPSEGAFQSRDALFRRHGTQHFGCLQTARRQRFNGCFRVDYCRRGLLYHGRAFLLFSPEALHAFRLPLFRSGRFRMPCHSRLGCSDGVY